MEYLNIKTFPEDVLRKQCEKVASVTSQEKKLLEQMYLSMHHSGGIGLAAPQVGVAKRIIVADIGEGAIKLINPEVIEIKGNDVMEEGCLSLPEIQVKVERPSEIVIAGLDEDGIAVEFSAFGLMARVLQHEIDHLNGTLIIDYLDLSDRIKACMKQPL